MAVRCAWAGTAALLFLLGTSGFLAAAEPLELRTADTVICFSTSGKAPRITTLAGPESANWVNDASEAPLPEQGAIDGDRADFEWKFERASSDRGELTFQYRCQEPKLVAKSTWRAYSGPGPIEHELSIVNESETSVLFGYPPTTKLSLTPSKSQRDCWWVEKGAGHVTDVGVHREAVGARYARQLLSGPYSTDGADRDSIPWFAIADADGKCGVYGGIEFSGWTEINLATNDAGELGLALGMQRRDGASQIRLAPGASWEAPVVFIGAYQGDVDDGCNRLHRWVETHLRPALPWGATPILVNNSWGSGMAVDEVLARKMIDDCAELGMEIFQLDAGWYRNVGDWRPNPTKFPQGIAPVANYAHERGVKFGMWIGWTQGGTTTEASADALSPLNPLQREWFGRDMPAGWKNDDFIGEPVCLGADAARKWCARTLERIVVENKLDLLEHDQDMMLDRCIREGHDHRPGDDVDVSRATAQGYYGIYDQLRQKFPRLLFEDCVNGGRLVDFGVVRRVHYICATDVYDPLTCRRAFYDASYPLPPSMVEVYLENVPTKSEAEFASVLRSALLGWATIMMDTSRWSSNEREIAKRQFEIYKEKLRPLIADGNLYHVLPRPTGQDWDGVQYFEPRSSSGALLVFRTNSPQRTKFVALRGLAPEKRYAFASADGRKTSQPLTGGELMSHGLPVEIAEPDGSDIIFIEQTGDPAVP